MLRVLLLALLICNWCHAQSPAELYASAPRGALILRSYSVVFDANAEYDTGTSDNKFADMTMVVEYPFASGSQTSRTVTIDNVMSSPFIFEFAQSQNDWVTQDEATFGPVVVWPAFDPAGSTNVTIPYSSSFGSIRVYFGDFDSLTESAERSVQVAVNETLSPSDCNYEVDANEFSCSFAGAQGFPTASNGPWEVTLVFQLLCESTLDCGLQTMTGENVGNCLPHSGQCQCDAPYFGSAQSEGHNFDCIRMCSNQADCSGDGAECDLDASTPVNIECKCAKSGFYLNYTGDCVQCPMYFQCLGPRGIATTCGAGEYPSLVGSNLCMQVPLGEYAVIQPMNLYLENVGDVASPEYHGSMNAMNIDIIVGKEPCPPGNACVNGVIIPCVKGANYQPDAEKSDCLNCTMCDEGFFEEVGCTTTTDTVCSDIDECATECQSINYAACTNTMGSYSCDCSPGFIHAMGGTTVCVREVETTTEASNFQPSTTSTASPSSSSSSSSTGVIVGAIIGVLVLVALVILFVFLRKSSSSSSSQQPSSGKNFPGVSLFSRKNKWDIPRSAIQFGDKLGGGQFGDVLEARVALKDGVQTCAAKTLRPGVDHEQNESFMREINIMKRIGNHHNIVTMFGHCLDKFPLVIILELARHGNLRDYLRSQRASKLSEQQSITARELLDMCTQIANGMSFIATSGVVHGDLAARNILVGRNNTIKISDFGFSHVGEFSVSPHERLPLKWMAPETISSRTFTLESDIWSFGITFWEVFTLGASPYPSVDANKLPSMLQSGKRLECPAQCPPELYRLVPLACFDISPEKRPPFSQLVRILRDMQDDRVCHNVKLVYYSSIDDQDGQYNVINTDEDYSMGLRSAHGRPSDMMMNPVFSDREYLQPVPRDYLQPQPLQTLGDSSVNESEGYYENPPRAVNQHAWNSEDYNISNTSSA